MSIHFFPLASVLLLFCTLDHILIYSWSCLHLIVSYHLCWFRRLDSLVNSHGLLRSRTLCFATSRLISCFCPLSIFLNVTFLGKPLVPCLPIGTEYALVYPVVSSLVRCLLSVYLRCPVACLPYLSSPSSCSMLFSVHCFSILCTCMLCFSYC